MTRTAVAVLLLAVPASAAEPDAVRKAATFYASFDEELRGDFGGSPVARTRFNHPTEKGKFTFEDGTDAKAFKVVAGKGVSGGALEVSGAPARGGWAHFPAKGNLAFKKGGWGGSLSVWCKLNPDTMLKTKFCDPVQLTQKGYDNGAMWFDFNDAKPRDLRYGAFTARADNQKAVPETDPKVPMVRAPGVGWKADDWHHVVLTWANLDTGKPDAATALYLDGKFVGEVKGQAIAMDWDVEKANVYFALGYIGLLDELALFDRPLAADEVKLLRERPDLLAPLKKAGK